MSKVVLIGVAMVAATVLLLFAGMRGGGFVYYKSVSEYLDGDVMTTDGFRVNGKVVEGSIVRSASGEDVEFLMSDGLRTMPVRYHGIIPDTFVDNADVVVQGGLGSDEVFAAHELLAKCPSKYEAADDYAPGETGPDGYGPGKGYDTPEGDTAPADAAAETARLAG